MLGNRHEIARMQSDFYRDQFRRILRWMIYAIIIIYLLIGAIVYLVLSQPTRNFYANTTDGQILSMPSVYVQGR